MAAVVRRETSFRKTGEIAIWSSAMTYYGNKEKRCGDRDIVFDKPEHILNGSARAMCLVLKQQSASQKGGNGQETA